MVRGLLPALLFAAAFPVCAADTDWQSRSGSFRVSYQSELVPVVINRIHTWKLHIEDEYGAPVSGASISVKGGMPVHDHGLPTAPRITREIQEGDYLLEGMRFHMPGEWEIEITIEAAGERDVVVIPLKL